MKSSTPRDVTASPLGVPLDLLIEQGTGSAIIEISHGITSDSPDGQPWPPPDSGAPVGNRATRPRAHALARGSSSDLSVSDDRGHHREDQSAPCR
jgi:hypothetical protein